jgi:hypothetical protein
MVVNIPTIYHSRMETPSATNYHDPYKFTLLYVCSYDSECKMVTDWKDSTIQQEALTNEIKNVDLKLTSLLSTHLAHEKELRAER